MSISYKKGQYILLINILVYVEVYVNVNVEVMKR